MCSKKTIVTKFEVPPQKKYSGYGTGCRYVVYVLGIHVYSFINPDYRNILDPKTMHLHSRIIITTTIVRDANQACEII